MNEFNHFTGDTPEGGTGNMGNGAGIVGAILQTGGALYDSWRNREAARQNTDKTIAAQKAESELAYQRSVEMWNMQNAYNSPQAQMHRFLEAGLNPRLMYGSGNPGNAVSAPSYQPTRPEYHYQAMQPGSALSQVLPTLMAVGTWMQNMRQSEVQIQKAQTDTDRVKQLIEFLVQRNPQLLTEGRNKISLFPYQQAANEFRMGQAHVGLESLRQEFRYKYGEELFSGLIGNDKTPPYGGLRRLEFLHQATKNRIAGYEEELKKAQSSWTDFDITNPQGLMQLVMQGVMGLAGTQLRLSQRPKVTHELEHRMSTGRVNTRRRIVK